MMETRQADLAVVVFTEVAEKHKYNVLRRKADTLHAELLNKQAELEAVLTEISEFEETTHIAGW